MDIRAEIQRTYRDAYEGSCDKTIAFIEAAICFQEVAGYVPDKALLERLLKGALLGTGHPLMQLLHPLKVRPVPDNPSSAEAEESR